MSALNLSRALLLHNRSSTSWGVPCCVGCSVVSSHDGRNVADPQD